MQMTVDEKFGLLEMIRGALERKNKREGRIVADEPNFESDVSKAILLQKIWQDHSLKKQAILEQQKFVKNLRNAGKISKPVAFELDYDFYF